jgi:hypothetical protein
VVSGDKRKADIFSEFINDDQAMPFMLPSPSCMLAKSVDIERFLQDVPFRCLYDGMSLVL